MVIGELTEIADGPLFDLMGEVEAGRHFDRENPEHVEWLRDRIRRHYGRGTRFFALYEGDEPVGIVGLLIDTHLNTEWSLGYITDLGVMPALRGRGCGSKLLEFVAEEAARQHCYCVYVDTYAGNADNVSFYAKNGYVPVATLPDMNGPGDEGQVWLRKVLA